MPYPVAEWIARLKSDDVDRRREAARGLAHYVVFDMWDEQLVQALTEALDSNPDLEVQGEAAIALHIMGIMNENALLAKAIPLAEQGHLNALTHTLVSDAPGPRQHTIAALKPYGERATKALIIILETGNSFGRYWAARALGMLGDKHAVDSLIATLHDESVDNRTAAAWALGLLGDARATPALEEMARTDTSVDSFKSRLSNVAEDAIAAIKEKLPPQ